MSNRGFTLLELMILMGIITIVAIIAIPNYINYAYKAKVAQAIAEIRMLEKEIWQFRLENDSLPITLADIGFSGFKDPWGTPYQYLKIEGVEKNKGKGLMRKDRFLVPVNSDYDLYSMGRDCRSVPPFTSNLSQDDIVRANDGRFLGFASEY